ncbi:Hsp20/alpha crystallin family protein [Actinokineospora auranticolor]|uniref:HSP20 family molecular chaperone IbpA n=1 Tax=Actinokineospora auranticolor TaxID=155976 RepID=A0A2S6GIU4_9PSEU|nr:Hsp20/alpha crystallin family protein [Actinokineospora auranticolor]PPK65154.1 HSP20 family molecular chaperone IbpA [Actinokineospora auranticolor]
MTGILPRTTLIPDVFRLFEALPTIDRHIVRVEDYFDDGTYVVRAELPGLDPEEDIAVTVQGDTLTITAQRVERRREHGRSEFHYGSFARSVALPRGASVDRVEATYDKGILTLTVPVKTEGEAKRITVNQVAE